MTADQTLEAYRELRALERLQAVILAQPALAFEWRCALTALEDRLRWVRYGLSLEPQARLNEVQARYERALLMAPPEPPAPVPDLPRHARIH